MKTLRQLTREFIVALILNQLTVSVTFLIGLLWLIGLLTGGTFWTS